VTIAGFGMALAGPAENERLMKRAQGIARDTREGQRRGRREANEPGQRRKQMLASLQEAERKQRKATLSVSAKLQQAGLSVNPRVFWIASGGLAAVLAVLLLVLSVPPLIALGFAIGMGLGLPRWVLGFLGQRRIKKFTAEFANAIDIIVRGIKSGLPVHDCLKIIARESPEPLAGEFTRLVENIGMGMTMEQAMEKAYERMPTAELRFFAIVLAIQQKTGGNLAEALGNLSAVLRSRKMMREKIKALSSEATASAMIISILPPGVMVMVTVMTPSYMMKMFTDPRGHMLLAASVVWMGIGGFIMRRMINFKF
ncbi:MAG TPA: type II secretion system F family protein, partial [Roseococcus sp.]|nr:type II secretion system F family protein [Roseococcus sp.]